MSQTRLPSAWQSRPARSATASSTGCTSVGDSLITRSTSAVAVWRSSASLVSLNRRAFWIAMTAWSANVLSSASSFAVNGEGGWRTTMIEPMPWSSHSIGTQAAEKLPTCSTVSRAQALDSAIWSLSPICTMLRLRMARPVALLSTGMGKVRVIVLTIEPRIAAGCTRPSSRTTTIPRCSVPNSRWQLSRIFSNTGFGSAIELLITCSTSAVAVCCSSASWVSLNSRAFCSADRRGRDGGQQPLVVGIVGALGLRALDADHAQAGVACDDGHPEVRPRLTADDVRAELQLAPVHLAVDDQGLACLDDPAGEPFAILQRLVIRIAVLVREVDHAARGLEQGDVSEVGLEHRADLVADEVDQAGQFEELRPRCCDAC